MPKKLYQVHAVFEIAPIIGGQISPQIMRTYKYVIADSSTDAEMKTIIPSYSGADEVYALEVTEQTIKDEIKHCKDLIKLWDSQSEEIKKKEKVNECIIPRQKNLITYYKKLLKELKDASSE